MVLGPSSTAISVSGMGIFLLNLGHPPGGRCFDSFASAVLEDNFGSATFVLPPFDSSGVTARLCLAQRQEGSFGVSPARSRDGPHVDGNPRDKLRSWQIFLPNWSLGE